MGHGAQDLFGCRCGANARSVTNCDRPVQLLACHKVRFLLHPGFASAGPELQR